MFISSKNITMLAIFDTNQDISLAEINIKFTKCSNNTVAIVYSKQVVILFFECKFIETNLWTFIKSGSVFGSDQTFVENFGSVNGSVNK